MKINEILTESTSTNLLIVDVQPEYSSYADSVLPDIAQLIARSTGRIAVLYNGEGNTEDNMHDVLNYLSQETDEDDYDDETDEYVDKEPSIVRQKLGNAKFFQKEYGFFRSWMDQSVSDATIIKVIRLMAMAKVNDSRMLDTNTVPQDILDEVYRSGIGWDDDGIQFPDAVSIGFLKQISPFYMVGGGRSECLREIELLANAFNIRYRRIDSMIY